MAFGPLGAVGDAVVVAFFGAAFSLTSLLSPGACYESRRPRIGVVGGGVSAGRAPSILTSSLLFAWALDAILTGPGRGELGRNPKILVVVFSVSRTGASNWTRPEKSFVKRGSPWGLCERARCARSTRDHHHPSLSGFFLFLIDNIRNTLLFFILSLSSGWLAGASQSFFFFSCGGVCFPPESVLLTLVFKALKFSPVATGATLAY